MNWKKTVSFLAGGLLCLAPVLWLLYTGKLQLLLKIPLHIAIVCIVLTFFSVVCSGLQYFISLRHMGCGLEKKDIVFLPYMQSLFGLIIPFQGTSLFTVCYLKMRYSFQMTQSVVMILFLYLLNFVFGGLAGVAYSCVLGKINTLLFYGSVGCLLMPLWCFLLFLILKKKGNIPFMPEKYCRILLDSMSSMNDLLSNFSLLLKLLSIQIVRQCIMALGYILICRQFGSHPNFLWGYLIIVSQEIAVIFRLTPGNLGMTEMIAGLISQITGIAIETGVICSLVMSLLHLLQTFLFGISGIWMQLQGFSLSSLPDFLRKIKNNGN